MAKTSLRLTGDQVRHKCSVDHFTFKTTADIEFVQTIIGQPRGVKAIEFGIDVEARGFNIYILGPTGTGRTTAVRHFLEGWARQGEIPNDWVYVYNFEVAHQPRAIELPPGQGSIFREKMAALVGYLKKDIPSALEAEEFVQGMETLTEGFNRQREEVFERFSGEAQHEKFAIVRTPGGLMLIPIGPDGQPMSQEQIQQLEAEVRAALEEKHGALQEKLSDSLHTMRDLDREFREDQDRLKRVAAAFVVDQYIGDLKEEYADHEEVLVYLTTVREDVLKNLDDFAADEEEEGAEGTPAAIMRMPDVPTDDPFKRYAVNLIIDHSKTQGAPVIVEESPSYSRLVGRIEGEVRMGALHTDFTMIKPGALHRANGGYLVLRVTDLLSNPGAWEGLKRALNSNEIRIEESMIRQGLGILTPQTVEPEPIPLNLKVIMLGSPTLYYLLYQYEEDFPELFKIKADFASTMPRNHETEMEYATFIAARCHENGLPHFTPTAVGEMIEYGSRMADDQRKLSTVFGHISDLVHEAAYWARKAGSKTVKPAHVIQAIEERRYRNNLYEELVQERITERTIFIDTEGAIVGQINGLSVVGLGDYAFGQPSRITARVYMGKDSVVDIEREVEMSGPIHDKGVLILQGYLGGQYAFDHPLSLSASITFEQNYGGVEGDSASSTELYALLSALSGYPIKQSLAVTGSVNQRGEVQPIGGANEKIEGFFDVCNARGLTGEQGVLIPKTNVSHLMLRPAVADAIRKRKFHVYAVETIDQGIELLTDVPAGRRRTDGTFPEGTIHHAVQARLREIAEGVRDFDNPPGAG